MQPTIQKSPVPAQTLATNNGSMLNSAIRFAGWTLTMTGAKHYMRSALASTYNYLTGEPGCRASPEDTSPLTRKLWKLRKAGRPCYATTGYKVIDWFGHAPPAILAYHSPGAAVNYNGKVSRARYGQTETVMCRHLAYAYASGELGRKPAPFQEVGTEEAIKHSWAIPDEETFDRQFLMNGCPRNATYFNLRTFPDALYVLAQELKVYERKDYLLVSINHAMALSLVNRAEAGILLYFYDPNDTARHKRVMVRQAEDLKLLSMGHLLSAADKNYYFPRGLQAGCLLSPETAAKQEQCRVRYFAQAEPGIVFFLGMHGHYGAADIHGNPVKPSDTASKKQLVETQGCDGSPALFMAAQNGHAEAFKALIRDILDSLNKEDQIAFLAGKREDGVPALFIAAQNGHLEVVKVLLESILDKVDTDAQITLLAGKTANGDPALCVAAEKGHLEVFKVLVESIPDSLGIDAQIELLAGKRANGASALLIAVEKGYKKMVEFYVQHVLSSHFDRETKKALLIGRKNDKTSACSQAELMNHHEIAAILRQAILSIDSQD